MKKVLGLVMAVAVLGGTLTGCGSSGGGSGKDGYSSAEKAAMAYWEAYYTLGTDKMMKLMPAEAKEHWEDELSLTSEQLTAYMEQELEKKSDIIKTFKSVSVDEQEELSIDRIQNFGCLLYFGHQFTYRRSWALCLHQIHMITTCKWQQGEQKYQNAHTTDPVCETTPHKNTVRKNFYIREDTGTGRSKTGNSFKKSIDRMRNGVT